MKARTIRWLVVATGSLALAGCGHSQSAAIKGNPTPALRPFVFYDDTGEPAPHNPALSQHELQEIIDQVAAQTSDPIWLVRVRSLNEYGSHSVVAHLVPDEVSPRIRAGRAYDVYVSDQRAGIDSPWKYAQVSARGHMFTDRLTKPPVVELPFGWPTVADRDSKQDVSMSKEEAISIVDYVRQPSAYRDVTVEAGQSREPRIQEILASPILGIGREGDEITVVFGYVYGPLWGSGLQVRLRCTPTGYKVSNWGRWWS